MFVDWNDLWLDVFGTDRLFGVDMGFWAGMAAVALIVAVMQAVVWTLPPRPYDEED
ncbi:hypothetical protein [Corynebacterium sp. 335C]